VTAPQGVGGGVAPASNAAGSIYDLGYRRYDGKRLGRRHAVWALYLFSFRGTFGIGRSGRAKIAPFTLAFLALLPALISVGIDALTSQAGGVGRQIQSPIQYATYLGFATTLLILFCAAQAPDLVGRDQRYTVLPLYFSRALRRSDYALAKLAALWVALALVFLAPQLLIFVGRVLSAQDVPAAFGDNVGSVPPIVAVAALSALVLGSISVALASFTPRRAYATAAIIAIFIVPPIVASIVTQLTIGAGATIAALLDPIDLLDGANSWLFGKPVANDVLLAAGLPDVAYVPALIVYIALATALTIRRYQRIPA
jgi:ABC-2 type transport system permease protein